MDFSDKEILFQADKSSRKKTAIGAILSGILVLGTAYDYFGDTSKIYHDDGYILVIMLFALMFFAIFFLVLKVSYVQQFYIISDGFLFRDGCSGKWKLIAFDTMLAAYIAKTKTEDTNITDVIIICQNQKRLTISSVIYTENTQDKTLGFLLDKNIPLCRTKEKAEEMAASHAEEETKDMELLDSPFHTYLHYFATFLPFIVAGCLLLAGIINGNFGHRTDIVVQGVVIDRRTQQHGVRTIHELLIRSGQREQWLFVPDFKEFVIMSSVKVHCKKGSFGLDYDMHIEK